MHGQIILDELFEEVRGLLITTNNTIYNFTLDIESGNTTFSLAVQLPQEFTCYSYAKIDNTTITLDCSNTTETQSNITYFVVV